jgi:hypothetical protein
MIVFVACSIPNPHIISSSWYQLKSTFRKQLQLVLETRKKPRGCHTRGDGELVAAEAR